MQKVRTKAELMRIVPRFIKDKNRGISIKLFCDVCGISERTLMDVFIHHVEMMSERTQRRVDKGITHFMNGDLVVWQHKYYNTKRVEYREKPKPFARKSFQITVKDGQIGLKVGMKQRGDYSDPNLDELLK